MTFISRLLGVIREVILSKYLGASIEMDASVTALKFPKVFRKCFSEEGVNSVFVPILSELGVKKKNKFALFFSSKVFTTICFCMLLLTILVMIFTEDFVIFLAPGFRYNPEKLDLTIKFTRIIFPSVIFLSISAIYGGILIANQKFTSYTIAPLIMNVVMISSILIVKNSDSPGLGFSVGVLCATIMQALYLFSILKRKQYTMPHIANVKVTRTTKHFFKKLLPVIAGAGVAQINIFIDSFFSSYLFTGCITYLYFADRLNTLPLSLIGISLSIVLLPEISKKIAQKSKDLYQLYSEAILFALKLAFPITVIMACTAYTCIDIIYGHGRFTSVDVFHTSIVLKIISLGLPAYVLSKVFASILFAQKNTKAPVTAALVSIICNLVLNFILTTRLGLPGIAISTMIAGYVQMVILGTYLLKTTKFTYHFFLNIGKTIVSTTICLMIVLFFKKYCIFQFQSQLLTNIVNLSFCSLFGLLGYVICLIVLKDKMSINMFQYRK